MEQKREPKTNLTRKWRKHRGFDLGHIDRRRVHSALLHPWIHNMYVQC